MSRYGVPMVTIDELLAHFSPEVGDLVLRTRELVRSVMPEAHESVNLGWKNVWFGTGTKHADGLFVINPLRQRVNLNIIGGDALEDTDHLLEGRGRTMRHVKITAADDLDRPQLRRLLDAAVASRAESVV